ncbi:DNA replication/repair protein RecF [Bifidobacterium favimelis]|uniref:DNA replication and repair protein RecF n=1 Tax=Bifidobacterium favimelis TaxID=3122979 RepID=A0ABU8ZKV3_9BIFI
MYISRLVLDHYRSWETCILDLGPGVTILKGRNGLGKTNLVEAVEVLSTGTSHRVSSSLPLIQRGQAKAVIRARVEEGGTSTSYELGIPARGANRARVDGGPSLYMRDILGRIPSVTFSPEDQRMVSGEPAVRRGVLDQAAVQLNPSFYQVQQRFLHVARQRSALLKQMSKEMPGASGPSHQAALSGLEVWTGQFIQTGVELTRARRELIARLNEPFGRLYGQLAGGPQEAGLVYEPSFEEVNQAEGSPEEAETEISRHFQRIFAGEVARGQNLIGPQRDDFTFMLNGMPAREFASNGEMWTLALAFRLAVFSLLEEGEGTRPIVILDDVFAQLDQTRRSQILEFARRQEQVLITVAADSDIPPVAGARQIDVAALLHDSVPLPSSDPSSDDRIGRALKDLRGSRQSGGEGGRS